MTKVQDPCYILSYNYIDKLICSTFTHAMCIEHGIQLRSALFFLNFVT
jgi:hypothetical protein